MAYTLKQDANGLYTLDTQDVFKSTPAQKFNASEFEAYTPTQKTELVGGTDLGEQTKKVMREMPGQIQTITDPETGEVKTVQKGAGEVEVEQKPITSLTTTTSAAVAPETALDKVSKIMQQFPSGQAGGGFNADEYFNRIEQIQKSQQKAELTNRLIGGAFDLGINYLKSSMGGFSTGGITSSTASSFTPLSGGAYAPSSAGGFLTSPAGGGLFAAGATLLAGGSKKQAATTGVGTAIGTAVGGPIGGAIGGAIGSVIGCFLPDTLIRMADGSEKKIIDIDIKDNLEVGGLVFATGKFLINNLFDYKGIKVSGEHLVNESGKWLKVKQSQFAKSLGNDEHIVYTLGSQNRRILINNILFTDYFDFEEQKTLAA